jgi:hypothetical protein
MISRFEWGVAHQFRHSSVTPALAPGLRRRIGRSGYQPAGRMPRRCTSRVRKRRPRQVIHAFGGPPGSEQVSWLEFVSVTQTVGPSSGPIGLPTVCESCDDRQGRTLLAVELSIVDA